MIISTEKIKFLASFSESGKLKSIEIIDGDYEKQNLNENTSDNNTGNVTDFVISFPSKTDKHAKYKMNIASHGFAGHAARIKYTNTSDKSDRSRSLVNGADQSVIELKAPAIKNEKDYASFNKTDHFNAGLAFIAYDQDNIYRYINREIPYDVLVADSKEFNKLSKSEKEHYLKLGKEKFLK